MATREEVQELINEMIGQDQQPAPQPDLLGLQNRITELNDARRDASLLTSPPGLGAVGAFGQTVKGNLESRALGAGNSLLQGLDKLGIRIPPSPMLPITDPQQATALNRDRNRAIQDLNDAVAINRPRSAFLGDALTFGAEAALGGKGFRHSNPKVQLFGRTAQEAALGALYAGTTVAMTDEEKETAIATGLASGAIAPHAVTAVMRVGGKVFRLSKNRIERIARLTKMEKMFDKAGILTGGELLGHRGLMKVEAALDNIPFLGIGRKRARQKEAFQEIADDLITRFGAGRVPVRGSIDKQRKELGRLLYNQYHRNYDIVWHRYEAVARGLDGLPVNVQPKVRLSNMYDSAQEMLALERQLPKSAQNSELVGLLEGYIKNPSDITWSAATRLLRRIKEQAVVQMERATKKETTREYGAALNKLEAALYADMNEFADFAQNHLHQSPNRFRGQNLVKQLEEANESFRNLVLPFHKGHILADVTRGEDFAVDNIVSTFLERTGKVAGRRYPPAGRPGSKRALDVEITTPMSALPPQGQQIVRGMMMREALDRSLKGRYFIEPDDFAAELGRMQKNWGVVFTREQQELLQGYTQLVEEAYRSFRKPADLGAVIAGGTLLGIGAAGDAAEGEGFSATPYLATVFGARMLLGTKGGTELLRMAAHIDDFSTKEGRHLMHVAEVVFTRYLTQNYPEIHKEIRGQFPAGPELKEAANNMFNHPVL